MNYNIYWFIVETSKIVGAHHEENSPKNQTNSLHNDVAVLVTKPKKAFRLILDPKP